MIFSQVGVPLYGLYIDPFWTVFDEKVVPFSEFLCLMEVSKIRFWWLFWEKLASIFQNFPKIVDF